MKTYVVHFCGWVLASWAVMVGLLITFAEDDRFGSVQWRFILETPGGQDTWGSIFFFLGCLMALGLLYDEVRFAGWVSVALGGLMTIFATILAVGAITQETGGIMGGPTFGLIGLFYVLYNAVSRER